MKKIFLVLFSALLLFAGHIQFAYAQPKDPCADLNERFSNAEATDLANKFTQYCSEGEVYKKVTTVLYSLIGIFAVIALIYGGYVYMTARGNQAQVTKGRTIITWTLIGFIVVLLAVVLVNVITRAIQSDTLF